MSTSALGAGDDVRALEEAVLRRVAEQAEQWFPDAGPRPAIRLHPLVDRPRAALWAVHVGEGSSRPRVLAKVRKGWSGSAGGEFGDDRPRLVRTFLSTAEATALEYRGLQAIHGMVDPGDPHLGTVRPLDHLADENTLLMEYVDGVTLRQLLVQGSRLRRGRAGRGGPAADDVWQRAGYWLGRFQERVPAEGLPVRQATRDDVVALCSAFDGFLAERLGRRAAGDAGRRGADLAARVLPERLPLAVNHGDYAPRNVFCLTDGRLAAFDPMPRWAAPAWDDLCRMLVGIRLLGLQVYSNGTAFSDRDLARRERAVIEGYLAGAAPGADRSEAAVRWYQLFLTLDTWSAMVGSRLAGPGRALGAAQLRWTCGYLRGETRRLLELAGA